MTHAARRARATAALSRFSHKRGNDGLTDAERAAYAESWRNGAGRTPSKDEMKRLRSLPVTRKAG